MGAMAALPEKERVLLQQKLQEYSQKFPFSLTHKVNSQKDTPINANMKTPSGCVGAYARVMRQAQQQATSILKQQRQRHFASLSVAEQSRISNEWIDACIQDNVEQVQTLVKQINVDGFYLGPDGTETCALHASAFHNSCRVLEFLCAGLDQDGGMANTHVTDSNGWTALHFAAGANHPQAARVLTQAGAPLHVEAVNGYTPLQWAVRLQNTPVAEELQQWSQKQAPPPLVSALSKFWALVPARPTIITASSG